MQKKSKFVLDNISEYCSNTVCTLEKYVKNYLKILTKIKAI